MWVKCCRLIDYNMFDCLLTLCELCKDLPPLLRDLWQLLMLMLIPTQADLLQQSGVTVLKHISKGSQPQHLPVQ